MKKYFRIIAFVFWIVPGYTVFAQDVIPVRDLAVCLHQTSNLIFPYRIQKADIGSGDVIGRLDPALPNVLFLKANRTDFPLTSLSVYTTDGKFYSFAVRYAGHPDTLNLSYLPTGNGPARFSDSATEAGLDSDAVSVADAPVCMERTAADLRLRVTLKGIFLKNQRMWFVLQLENLSEVDFKPEAFRFFVCDKQQGKRTAVQETELHPVWASPMTAVTEAKPQTYLFSFPAFIPARSKRLLIDVTEAGGGRQLRLSLKPKTFLRARAI